MQAVEQEIPWGPEEPHQSSLQSHEKRWLRMGDRWMAQGHPFPASWQNWSQESEAVAENGSHVYVIGQPEATM